MVVVAQLVRALDCGSRGRRFETGLPPIKNPSRNRGVFFFKHSCTSENSFQLSRLHKYTKNIKIGSCQTVKSGNNINMEHLSIATYIVKATDKSNNEESTYKVVKN